MSHSSLYTCLGPRNKGRRKGKHFPVKGLVLPSRGKREKGSFGNKNRNAKKGGGGGIKTLLTSTLPFLFQDGCVLYCSQIGFLCRWCGPRITSPAEQPRASLCQDDQSWEECIITDLRGTCQCIPCWGCCDGGGREETILHEDWKKTLWRKDLGSQSCCLL